MGNPSFSTITPGNFELSPCRVTFDGVDLGATVGNVMVKIESDMAELKSDQLGTTVIDRKISGFKVSIETALAETKLKDNWKVVFPSYKLVESGGNKLMYFDSQVGQSQIALAKRLVLHPLSNADSDLSGDVTVFLAGADSKSELPFGPTEQQKLKIVWQMYPDLSVSPPRFMAFGDLSIGLVAASAGSAVAATGNVGNGTIGSIVANSNTKTETISLSCLVAGGAGTGKFVVSGTISGDLGIATVGTTLNKTPISLLITAGGTPFSAGDSFTIATVAANYS